MILRDRVPLSRRQLTAAMTVVAVVGMAARPFKLPFGDL